MIRKKPVNGNLSNGRRGTIWMNGLKKADDEGNTERDISAGEREEDDEHEDDG